MEYLEAEPNVGEPLAADKGTHVPVKRHGRYHHGRLGSSVVHEHLRANAFPDNLIGWGGGGSPYIINIYIDVWWRHRGGGGGGGVSGVKKKECIQASYIINIHIDVWWRHRGGGGVSGVKKKNASRHPIKIV